MSGDTIDRLFDRSSLFTEPYESFEVRTNRDTREIDMSTEPAMPRNPRELVETLTYCHEAMVIAMSATPRPQHHPDGARSCALCVLELACMVAKEELDKWKGVK